MADNEGQENNNNNNNNRRSIIWNIIMMFLVYYLLFGSKSGGGQSTVTSNDAQGNPVLKSPHSCLVPFGTHMDMFVYRSESERIHGWDGDALVWSLKDIVFGEWNDEVAFNYEFEPTNALKNNGSFYLHCHFVRKDSSPNPSDAHFKKPLFSSVTNLVKYLPVAKVYERKNLISGEVDPAYVERKRLEQELNITINADDMMAHWKPNMTISLITDVSSYPQGSIPPQVSKYMQFDSNNNYYPIVYFNDFWLLDEDLNEINRTTDKLSLRLSYEPISLIKFSFMSQMGESWKQQNDWTGGATSSDVDEFKKILLDNDPYILGFTFAISIVHMVLDTLAFKNEISFWKNRKSMEGLSVRSIYINVICNAIILLYLWDNEDTSWMILFSCGLGLAIEVWKLSKAVKVELQWTAQGIPYPKFSDKSSYESATKEHDLHAMKYLYYSLYPILIGYSIYSLYYENHKSWYSWVVGSLAGCVYTFGFIMMTPQLFINYKLKSVAHLPWRTFVYKAISTFIDDLFAFLIRMPTLHRLRVFRDDIVFLIYLYQRWIYRVDKNRLEVGAEFTDINLEEIRKEMEEQETKNTEANTEEITTTELPPEKPLIEKKND